LWEASLYGSRRHILRGLELKVILSDRTMLLSAGALTALAALSSLLLPASPITFVLMILFLFFLPGYALTKLIFRRELELEVFILSSIALSVVASVLIASGLAVSPIKLTQQSVLVSLVGVTLVALLAAYLRMGDNRRYELEIQMPKREDVDPVIAVAIAFGLVLAGIFAYLIITANPPTNTSINLLSQNGDDDMPSDAAVGNTVNFTVVMKNGEGHGAEFRVQVFNNSNLYEGTENPENTFDASMDDNETVQRDFSLVFSEQGQQKVEARVFIDGEFYGELHFWVNVL
jgi:uncharacterized membrane protein